MKKYFIIKYSSRNISEDEEWTAISDIGKVYNGVILTMEEYKKMEDAYVNAILEIMEYMNIQNVYIKNVFRWKNLKKDIEGNRIFSKLYTDAMLKIYEDVKDAMLKYK